MKTRTVPTATPVTKPAVSRAWFFASDSNAEVTYETMQYTNGSTSCSCPGWTRRVDAQGQRSCKHTRMVHAGLANSVAKKFVDYGVAIVNAAATAATAMQKELCMGSRKFNFEA